MTQILRSGLLALALSLAALPAAAACFADYKAKMDAPLRLHYGVIELPEAACSEAAAAEEIARRIGRDGWTLLTVMGVFREPGLTDREEAAGAFFLRY